MNSPKRDRKAFTLVELLAVVAIIVLLIGIVVPAVTRAAKTTARKTATQADITMLATGLQVLRADAKVGGSYPPSASDSDGSTSGPPKRQIANPYANLGISGANIEITGAGLLTFALLGADQLGTPGFRPFKPNSSFWSQDTDANFVGDNSDTNGAYAIDKDNQTARGRSGPFVELSRVRLSKFNSTTKSFEVPVEVALRGAAAAPKRQYPMFLDSFGQPILYYRADPAGLRLTDANSDRQPAANPENRGVYHWKDNEQLTSGTIATPGTGLVLADRSGTPAAPNIHSLNWSTVQPAPSPTAGALVKPSDWSPHSFQRYIQNASIQAKRAPYNADSYLLISAGPDGLYGTNDDIANFQHNGEN